MNLQADLLVRLIGGRFAAKKHLRAGRDRGFFSNRRRAPLAAVARSRRSASKCDPSKPSAAPNDFQSESKGGIPSTDVEGQEP
jgi:hypothetical protein